MFSKRHFQHASTNEINDQNTKDDNAFIDEVGKWTDKNFSRHNTFLGMAEEIGEACHALLKRLQAIRGYDDPTKFLAEYSDALADCAVYGAHLAYLHPEIRADYTLSYETTDQSTDEVLADLFRALANVAGSKPVPGQLKIVMNDLSKLAALEGLDLRDITFITWDTVVSRRDWVGNPAGQSA